MKGLLAFGQGLVGWP